MTLTRVVGVRDRRKGRDARRKRKQAVREKARDWDEEGTAGDRFQMFSLVSEQVQSQVARPRSHSMTNVGRKCRIKVVNLRAFVLSLLVSHIIPIYARLSLVLNNLNFFKNSFGFI